MHEWLRSVLGITYRISEFPDCSQFAAIIQYRSSKSNTSTGQTIRSSPDTNLLCWKR